MYGDDAPEIGYWLTLDSWGRGYATEAGEATLVAARSSLDYSRFVSGHLVDNPASGRMLEKLGFRRTGRIELRFSKTRNRMVDCVMFKLDNTAYVDDPEMVQSLAA